MRVIQILILTVGLLIFGNILGNVSGQNNSNSNSASNRYGANMDANGLPIRTVSNSNSNTISESAKESEYDYNFGEVPKMLKIISTERDITFSKNGDLKVQVIEEVGKHFVIRFVREDEEIVAQFIMNQLDFKRLYFHSPVDPKIRLKVIEVEGFSSPLVHAVIVQPGGSDYSFWSVLFGEVNGKIKLLTPPTTTFSWEGGIQIGDLGKGNGVGLAVWNSIWDSDEGHYGAHRYMIEFYKFNKKIGKFVKTKKTVTKNKHETPAKALDSLDLGFYKDAVRDFPELLEYRVSEEETEKNN